MRLALADWTNGTTWINPRRPDCSPVGGWGALDLGGHCIVLGNDDTVAIPGALRDLGDPDAALEELLSHQAISFIENRLGIVVDASAMTLRQLIRDILIIDWGAGKWKRATKGNDSWVRGFIGNLEIFAVPVVGGGTIFTEDFDKANSTTLGPDLTWAEPVGDAEVASNVWRNVTNSNDARTRAEHDVGSVDMYSQATLNYTGSGNNWAVMARWNAADTEFYQHSGSSATNDGEKLYKFVNPVFTQIGTTQSLTLNASTNYVLRLEVNGSSLTAKIDGANSYNQTDTSITGNQRAGVGAFAPTANVTFNDFETGALADLVSGQPSSKRVAAVRFADVGSGPLVRRW